MCPSSSTHRCWPSVQHWLWPTFQPCDFTRNLHTHIHCRPRHCALRPPLHFSQQLGVGLSGEHELGRCQETLQLSENLVYFSFLHRATAPLWGFLNPATLPKTCTACTCAFPLSISLSDSNQLADLRANPNKYTLTVVSTSSTQSCFGKKWLSLVFG